MKGYLDRIEDNDKAVILIEEKNTEMIVPIDALPAGSGEKTWFHIIEEDDAYKVLSIDHETTEQKAKQAADLMAKLRQKKKKGKK